MENYHIVVCVCVSLTRYQSEIVFVFSTFNFERITVIYIVSINDPRGS